MAIGLPERSAAPADCNDLALVVRSRSGDVAAYGELVRRHQLDVLRVATALAAADHAEDVAQDAFVKAFRMLGRFDDQREFRPWLLAITANTARNHRRSQNRWLRRDQAAGGQSLFRQPPGTPEDLTIQRSDDQLVLAALAALPPNQREVVTCRYLLDMSEAETAAVLSIAPGTAKSRLARGLARLNRQLQGETDS